MRDDKSFVDYVSLKGLDSKTLPSNSVKVMALSSGHILPKANIKGDMRHQSEGCKPNALGSIWWESCLKTSTFL